MVNENGAAEGLSAQWKRRAETNANIAKDLKLDESERVIAQIRADTFAEFNGIISAYEAAQQPLLASHLLDLQSDFESKGYWIRASDQEDVRHVIMHLVKELGPMASLIESYEHDVLNDPDIVKGEAVPEFPEAMKRKFVSNLLIYALHFALRWNYKNLAGLVVQRNEENAKRINDAVKDAQFRRQNK